MHIDVVTLQLLIILEVYSHVRARRAITILIAFLLFLPRPDRILNYSPSTP